MTQGIRTPHSLTTLMAQRDSVGEWMWPEVAYTWAPWRAPGAPPPTGLAARRAGPGSACAVEGMPARRCLAGGRPSLHHEEARVTRLLTPACFAALGLSDSTVSHCLERYFEA